MLSLRQFSILYMTALHALAHHLTEDVHVSVACGRQQSFFSLLHLRPLRRLQQLASLLIVTHVARSQPLTVASVHVCIPL